MVESAGAREEALAEGAVASCICASSSTTRGTDLPRFLERSSSSLSSLSAPPTRTSSEMRSRPLVLPGDEVADFFRAEGLARLLEVRVVFDLDAGMEQG